jgi:tRNA threonylcarbamoyladenosine biosynthesis protein TsaB
MERILQVETATELCSVALVEKGNVLSLREISEGKSHAGVLTVFIQEILKEAKIQVSSLDAVAVSMGPGSFTGLRIGVSVAKGICYGTGIPLIAVPTLDSMFHGFRNALIAANFKINHSDIFIPMIDARRLEVYMAIYDHRGSQIKETCAKIVVPDSFDTLLEKGNVFFFGSGSYKLKEIISHKNAIFSTDFVHSSANMSEIALNMFRARNFANTAYFEPFYLKDFISTIPKKISTLKMGKK